MTAITQHLPWFIKDLGVSIIGPECYSTLVENLHITNVPCLRLGLSKGLGIGIVAGGAIMKIPQIILITSARSARGLSLESYVLETTAYAIMLAYAVRHAFPFTTYGENFFLTLQNIFITFLIIFFAPRRALTSTSSSPIKLNPMAVFGIVVVIGTLVLAVVPFNILAFLQLTTLPLGLFAKLPQIRQNHRARSTGQLSAFAVGGQIAGCAARVFTTMQEVGDVLVLAGYALALALNCVLALQIWMYWDDADLEAGMRAEDMQMKSKDKGAVWDQGEAGSGLFSPIPYVSTSTLPPPRTFSRKVL